MAEAKQGTDPLTHTLTHINIGQDSLPSYDHHGSYHLYSFNLLACQNYDSICSKLFFK